REEEEKRAKEAAEAEEKRAKEAAERMHQMWEKWVEQSERELQAMWDRLEWEMEWRRQTFGAKTFDPLFQAVGGKWDEAGRPVISFTNLIQNLGDVAGNVLMQIGQGLGSMLESWVMLGDQADVSMRKMVASVLAGVAAQAATLSLFHFAMGLVALTPWGAIEYGSPTYHFTAAAIWAAIAGGTALAGRAIAGDSAKSAAGSKKDGTRQSDRNMTPPPISRVSPDAYNSSRRDPAIADLAESVAKLSDKLSSMRPADVIVAAGREKPGLIGRIAIENVKENASLGTELLRRAGVR
ncbi:MAG: hypothetical protein C4287_23170, partial [Leptolyngbya sp. ERB_1_2]